MFHKLESRQDVGRNGRQAPDYAPLNNYLGLTVHPEVMETTIKAIEKYGTGCSRFLNGTLDMHTA